MMILLIFWTIQGQTYFCLILCSTQKSLTEKKIKEFGAGAHVPSNENIADR